MIRFFRHLKEAIKGLKRNGLITFLSLLTMTVTLTLLGLFIGFMVNVERLTTGVAGNVQISTYLVFESTDAQEKVKDSKGKEITNPDYHKLYDQIMALPNVEGIEFSSKDEQAQQLIEEVGEEFKFLEQDNSLLDVYVVSATSPDAVTDLSRRIEELDGVDEVTYGGLKTEQFFKFVKIVRLVGAIVTGLVLLLAMFFIANTIRLTIIARADDIQIMRLVGATKSYIRGPFLIEGSLIGLLGSILPVISIYFIYHFLYQHFNPRLMTSGLSLYPPQPFIYFVIGGLVFIGMVIGSLSSRLSMRKYLKY